MTTNNPQPTSSIIAKIQKLLALSEKNNSPEEAASAAALAADLMFKYQIGEVDLEVGEVREEAVVEDVLDPGSKKKAETWRGCMVKAVADSLGCHVFLSRRAGKPNYHIIGTKSSVQAVGYLFNYLTMEINRLADEALKGDFRTIHGKTLKNSFRMGAVHSVSVRLQEQANSHRLQVDSSIAAGNASPGLVMYKSDQERVEEYYAQLRAKLHIGRPQASHARHDAEAYNAGRQAGANISLGAGLGLAAPKSRIEG